MIEHRNGFSCGDMEDRVDDLERELGDAYVSLHQIRTWLGKWLEQPDLPSEEWLGLIQDAHAEAQAQVGTR